MQTRIHIYWKDIVFNLFCLKKKKKIKNHTYGYRKCNIKI